MYAAGAVAALLMLGLSMEVQATPIDLSGGDTVTEDKTEFTYSEIGLDDYQIADQEEGTFEIFLSHFEWASGEAYLSWDIDGIADGTLKAYDTSALWTISNSDMTEILSDGKFSLTINFPTESTTTVDTGTNTDADTDWGPSTGGFVWELSYESGPSAPVPEPATMLLMATGLLGLGAARRKKKTV